MCRLMRSRRAVRPEPSTPSRSTWNWPVKIAGIDSGVAGPGATAVSKFSPSSAMRSRVMTLAPVSVPS